MDGESGQIVAPGVLIFQLRHVEHAVSLGFDEERIVLPLPSVVASTVVEAVLEGPSILLHVEVERQPRQRIVGYGVAGSDGGEDATRTVGEERRDVCDEEVLIHVPHTRKEVRVLPLVHVTQNGYRGHLIVCEDVGKALPVLDDAFSRACYMQRGGFERPFAFPHRHTQVEPQEVYPVGLFLHIPLPLRGVFTAEPLCAGQERAEAGQQEYGDASCHLHCLLRMCAFDA